MYQVSFNFNFQIIFIFYFGEFSCFGIEFLLRKQPSESILNSLLSSINENKKPIITCEYYGFTSHKTPIVPICKKVIFIFSFTTLQQQLLLLFDLIIKKIFFFFSSIMKILNGMILFCIHLI